MSEVQSLGFPNIQLQALARPTPQPPKNRGRWLIGFVLVAGVSYIGYNIWDAFLRHSAYGIVSGKVVDVAAPYPGAIISLQVKEGDKVQQGQLLAVVENPELRHQYLTARDNLAMASAQLEANLSKFKLDFAFQLDANAGALVRYYELIALLAGEQGRAEELKDASRRADALANTSAVSAQEAVGLRARYHGQLKRVVELKESLDKSKVRLDKLEKVFDENLMLKNWEEQLRPIRLKIEHATAEVERLKERMDLGKIIAPVSGTVVKRHHFAGEQCDPSKSLFSVLEDNTLYVILYLQQTASGDFQIGDTVELQSHNGDISCTVERFSDWHEPAPDSIKRFYKVSQYLLPMHLRMNDAYDLRYGATVKLPYKWR